MKILITGATGFIGRNLVNHFSPKWNVTIITRNKRKAKTFFSNSINIIEFNDNKTPNNCTHLIIIA